MSVATEKQEQMSQIMTLSVKVAADILRFKWKRVVKNSFEASPNFMSKYYLLLYLYSAVLGGD